MRRIKTRYQSQELPPFRGFYLKNLFTERVNSVKNQLRKASESIHALLWLFTTPDVLLGLHF
jgi:hypothetical protein